MRPLPILTACLVLASCASQSTTVQPRGDTESEMGGHFSDVVSTTLYIEQSAVQVESAQFVARLKALGPGANYRPLYEEYVPVIGANGVLAGITQLWPLCHGEGHDLGKVIQATVKDIGTSLEICRDGCYSGCMHGVLMEAFAGARDEKDPDGHVDVEIVKSTMDEICTRNTTMTSAYSPGDCAHATGHALMVLAGYRVEDAVRWCDEFSGDHMRYYCATGAYMEYVTERDRLDTASDAGTLYPCDQSAYPAACFRYKLVHVASRTIQKKSDVMLFLQRCGDLAGSYRLGCYHGAGNALMGPVAGGALKLQEVCTQADPDERFICIEGVMERMAKFHPEAAKKACSALPTGSVDRQTCENASGRGMYDMQKDLSLYTR